MVHKKITLSELQEQDKVHASTYSARFFREPVPKFEMPADGMPSDVAYQLCHDELNLDGNPTLNLATFVTTWMEPTARDLIKETLRKNLVDEDEYPQTKEIERRCVNMVARLFNSPVGEGAIGTSTVGSSEAIMLAALSHKFAWRNKRTKEGKPTDKPNIVMGANVQVVWDKFARYFEVEPKIIPMTPGRYTLSPDDVKAVVDENTICVVGVLGTTFTGAYDPIEEINDVLVKVKKEKGWDIPLHVDAASGGFIAPFIHPKFKWDFRLPQVRSINVSGHKYGMVYPGIGWAIWRNEEALPKELIFNVNYLGGEMPTFNLNFSRGGSHVIAQYYNFLRLGKEGYKQIVTNLMNVKTYLTGRLQKMGLFEILTDPTLSLPIVTVQLKEKAPFSVYDLSDLLRARGWIIPAYTMPPNAEEIEVLRIVVREGLSRDMADSLIEDIERAVKKLSDHKPKPQAKRRHGPC